MACGARQVGSVFLSFPAWLDNNVWFWSNDNPAALAPLSITIR